MKERPPSKSDASNALLQVGLNIDEYRFEFDDQKSRSKIEKHPYKILPNANINQFTFESEDRRYIDKVETNNSILVSGAKEIHSSRETTRGGIVKDKNRIQANRPAQLLKAATRELGVVGAAKWIVEHALPDERQAIRDIIDSAVADTPAAQAPASLPLPQAAPKLYANRPKGQNIIDFLKDPEGWGPYVERNLLTRPRLRQLDRKAYDALTSWLQRNPNLPSDVQLPSKSEAIDELAFDAAIGKEVPSRDLRKVYQTLAARQRRALPR